MPIFILLICKKKSKSGNFSYNNTKLVHIEIFNNNYEIDRILITKLLEQK